MTSKKDTISSYPDPNVPNHEKDEEEYQLAYAKRAYNDYMNNQYYGFANRAQKIKNKSYSISEEDTSIYKTINNISGDVAYSNIDFTPISIIPAFVDTVVNSILDKGFEITVTARDAMSQELKEKERKKLMGKMYGIEMSKKISRDFGIDVVDKDAPTSKEEVDFLIDTEYQDDMEIALEETLREVRLMNRAKEVDRYVVTDLVVNAEGVVRVRLDANGEIKYEFIPDENFFRSYSTELDNRRLKHAGHVSTMSVAELRKRVGTQWNEQQWEELARASKQNRHGINSGTAINMNDSSGSSNWYDTQNVDVVEVEWVDFNYDIYEYKETEYGFSSIHERDEDYTPSEKSKMKRELYRNTYQVVYKCSFVLGTDLVFDNGKAHNISINSNDFYTANLSYIVYTMYGKSIVQKIIPYAEQIQLIHSSMQRLATKARPSGVAIDVSVLENAVANGQGGYFQPLELAEMFDETGNLLYRSINEDPEMGRSHPPISPIITSIRDTLLSLIDLYNHQAAQIRLVSGVNDFRDGTNTHPKTLVGVQQQAMMASNNATYAVDNAFYDVVTRCAERTIEFFQDIMDNEEARSRYERILGGETMEVMERIKNTPIDMLSVDIQFEPTSDERAKLEEHIGIALQANLIELEDAIAIRRLNNIGLSEKMLIQRKKKKEEKMMEMQQAQAEQQQMMLQQEAEQKAQLLQMESQLKSQTEISIYSEQAKIDIWKEQQLAALKDGLLSKEIEGKIAVARVSAEAGMSKTQLLEQGKDNRDKSQKTMESKLIEQRKGRKPEQDFTQSEIARMRMEQAKMENESIESQFGGQQQPV